MVWNWLATIGTAIIGTAQTIFTQKYVTDRQKKNTTAIVKSNAALAERRDEMQVAQLKLQYIQEKERQKF